MTEDKNRIEVWQPQDFKGSDLLPVNSIGGDDHLVGRENVEQADLILPTLELLQGQSDAVTQGVEGAQPGKFYLPTIQEVFDSPIRVMLVGHLRGAFMPEADDKSTELCMSHDGIVGTKYGDCESCVYSQWGEDGSPPPCAKSHKFIAMTDFGPAILRFAKTSYKAARRFLTAWTCSRNNLWDFPVVVGTSMEQATIKGKKVTYYTMDLKWDRKETVPSAGRTAAMEFFEQVSSAHESGKLKTSEAGVVNDL